MRPLVSILIPAHNAGHWIADTLMSAITQTGIRFEVIVVDDGSTDNTLRIARWFQSGNVQVTSQRNAGAATARNRAFALSHGDYIQWLDADDLLAPDKIARQLEAASDQHLSGRTLLSCSWGSFKYRVTKARFQPDQLWQNLSPAEWMLNKFEHNLYMMNSAWLVSRELTQAAGPWDSQLSLDDDGEYFSRVLLASERVCFVPGARCYYRKANAQSLSHARSGAKLDSLCTSLLRQVEQLRTMDISPRATAAEIMYLQRWLIVFHPRRPDLVERLNATAMSLGEKLASPPLRWKYGWLKPIIGVRWATQLQFSMPLIKGSLLCHIDHLLFQWQTLMAGMRSRGRWPLF